MASFEEMLQMQRNFDEETPPTAENCGLSEATSLLSPLGESIDMTLPLIW